MDKLPKGFAEWLWQQAPAIIILVLMGGIFLYAIRILYKDNKELTTKLELLTTKVVTAITANTESNKALTEATQNETNLLTELRIELKSRLRE